MRRKGEEGRGKEKSEEINSGIMKERKRGGGDRAERSSENEREEGDRERIRERG